LPFDERSAAADLPADATGLAGAVPTDTDLPWTPPDDYELRPSGLGRSAVSGVLITAAFAVTWELVRALSGLVTARFLRPSDYALFGAAGLALAVVGTALSLNLGTRLVQVHEDPGDAYDYGFTIQVALAAVSVVLAVVIAPIVARVYHSQVLLPVCIVLGTQALFTPLGFPVVYVQRELRWWRQRAIASAGPATGIALTLLLAIRGLGVWSLVYGQLASGFVTAAIFWIQAHRRPRLRFPIPGATLRFFLSFGGPLWLGGLVAVLAENGLIYEVQLFLGLAMLGFFRVAIGLGDRIDRAEGILASVMFPVLSRTRDPDSLRRAFDLSSRVVLVWAVPTGLGLAVFAHDVVQYVLGPRWLPVVPLLWVEGVGETFNAIATMWATFYLVTGNSRPSFRMGVQVQLLMLLLVGVGARFFGLPGIVGALYAVVLISLGLRRHYIQRLFPGVPVLLSAVPLMGVGGLACIAPVVLGARYGMSSPSGLALRVLLFLAVYAVGASFVERGSMRAIFALLRERRLSARTA